METCINGNLHQWKPASMETCINGNLHQWKPATCDVLKVENCILNISPAAKRWQ
jgi:hypothetical protein